MRTMIWSLLLVCLAAGCVSQREARTGVHAQEEVRRVLDKQVAEWNLGNLAGFMETYAQGDGTRFASGGEVFFGWQTVFDRYRRKYGDKETMGTLRMSDIDVRVLGPDSALAFGRWHLKRGSGEISGLYTLVLRKTSKGWRIVHDHTSAAA